MARSDPWRNMPRAVTRDEVLGTLGDSKDYRNPVRLPSFGDDSPKRERAGTRVGDDWTHTERSRVHQPSTRQGQWPGGQRQKEYEHIFGLQTEWTRRDRLR